MKNDHWDINTSYLPQQVLLLHADKQYRVSVGRKQFEEANSSSSSSILNHHFAFENTFSEVLFGECR